MGEASPAAVGVVCPDCGGASLAVLETRRTRDMRILRRRRCRRCGARVTTSEHILSRPREDRGGVDPRPYP